MASVNSQLLVSPARSDSLKSVSSSHSVVSLTRRSRVRTRSGSLANNRGRSSGPLEQNEETSNDVRDELNAAYPLQSPEPGPSASNITPRSSKLFRRAKSSSRERDPAPNTLSRRPATTETSIGIDSADSRNQTAGPSKLKGNRRPRSLTRQTQSVSSDSSSQLSPVTPVSYNTAPIIGVRHNHSTTRDSSLSQKSVASSSLYPPSTPTVSNHGRPLTPVLQKSKERDDDIPFETDDNGYQEFDADDVSLRLRLLVNNNYFLPPAHSKPSAADFAGTSATTKKPTKPPSPGFLDIFRIGKSKSKPTTPVNPSPPEELSGTKPRKSFDPMTVTNFLNPQALPQAPVTRTPPLTQQGRVVVVREKMDDLISAAKQAEKESKNGGDHASRNSRRRNEEQFDGVIDPTDSVDLPPPSVNYPFTLQASAMQGLGIQDSVGAAVLADRLPPSQSPGLWSISTEEENWRKGLLQQAVGHSFNNSLASSFITKSSARSATTSISAMSTDYQTIVGNLVEPALELPVGQPIIPHAVLSRHVQYSPSMSRLGDGRPDRSLSPRLLRMYSAPEFQHGAPNSFNPPVRAETPVFPVTPLTPAPRKHIVNRVYSLSQSDLGDPLSGSPVTSTHSLPGSRNSLSPSRLADVYEAEVNTGRSFMSPPPVFVRGATGLPTFPYRGSLNSSLASETSGSHYFDDEELDDAWHGTAEVGLRPSTSLPSSNRPSMSDRPYPSPTVSAFRDALFDDRHPVSTETNPESSGQSSFVSALSAARYSMASPPPRASIYVPNQVLPPPPRSSKRPRSTPNRSSTVSAGTPTVAGPEPTPPIPISERDNLASPQIPTLVDDPGTKSVPPRSSISFFDNIQSDLHQMDEDYSSSDDGDQPTQRVVFVDSRTTTSMISLRPNLMRLGNNSTPQLGSSAGNREGYPAFDPQIMKVPIANVPAKPAFFASKKGGKGKQGISPLDFGSPPRPSSSLSGRSSKVSLEEGRKSSVSVKSQKSEFVVRGSQDESMRNLDGMVMRHLEAERDALKKLVAANKTTKAKW